MRARLFLLSHGRTAGRGAVRFPADDPLSEAGLLEAGRLAPRLPRFGRVLAGPAPAARDTAAALGRSVAVEPALRDQDFGAWTGRTLDEVRNAEPEAFAGWLAGAPSAGGESISDVAARIGAWLDAVREEPGRTLAVTHPAVLRAAVLHVLGAPASAAGRIDAGPLTLAEFSSDGRRWTFCRLAPPFARDDG
jgi:broad specificity phosphatase PhoE